MNIYILTQEEILIIFKLMKYALYYDKISNCLFIVIVLSQLLPVVSSMSHNRRIELTANMNVRGNIK